MRYAAPNVTGVYRTSEKRGVEVKVTELLRLDGKVALVTGGSRGLGLQIAEAYAEMGARLALTARKEEQLKEAAEHLRGLGAEVLVVPSDLSNTDAPQQVVDAVMKEYGQIDILVNNAGATWGAPAEEHPLEAWEKVIGVNLTGAFLLTQAVANASMIPREKGRIVNIASVAGLQGNDPRMMGTVAYNTSKGGLVNLTRALASEWAKYRITVNAIAPGYFPTKMTKGTLDYAEDAIKQFTPLGRLGSEDDLKGLAVLLASDASGYITGQVIAVDGGITVI